MSSQFLYFPSLVVTVRRAATPVDRERSFEVGLKAWCLLWNSGVTQLDCGQRSNPFSAMISAMSVMDVLVKECGRVGARAVDVQVSDVRRPSTNTGRASLYVHPHSFPRQSDILVMMTSALPKAIVLHYHRRCSKTNHRPMTASIHLIVRLLQ